MKESMKRGEIARGRKREREREEERERERERERARERGGRERKTLSIYFTLKHLN